MKPRDTYHFEWTRLDGRCKVFRNGKPCGTLTQDSDKVYWTANVGGVTHRHPNFGRALEMAVRKVDPMAIVLTQVR